MAKSKDEAGTPAIEPKRIVRALHPSRIGLSEQKFRRLCIELERGVTPDDLRNESFWAHVAKQLRPWDEIVARAEDGTFRADLIVLAAGKNFARVHVDRVIELSVAAPSTKPGLQGYEIEWGGTHAKFRVKRGPDVIKDQLESAEAADAWLRNHARAMAA